MIGQYGRQKAERDSLAIICRNSIKILKQLSSGGTVDLTTIESLLTSISTNSAQSNLQVLKTQADDLVETYTYLSAGDPVNRRIDTISYVSASLGITVTETFGYGGILGDYYVTSSTLT